MVSFRLSQLERIERLRTPGTKDGEPDPGLRERLLRISGCPDHKLSSDDAAGYRLFGNIDPVNGWPSSGEQSLANAEGARHRILENSGARRERGDWRLATKHCEAIWTILKEEQAKGWHDDPVEAGEAEGSYGKFASWLVFAVEETKLVDGFPQVRLRLCMDPDERNLATAILSKTPMAGIDGVAAMLQTLHAALASPLEVAKEDWDAGFRSLPLLPADRQLFCIHAADPHGTIWVFRPRRLMFGPRAAPAQFCRRSAALDYIAGSLLCVASTSHVDDHVIADKAGQCASSAHESFVRLATVLGDPLKATKAVPGRGEAKQAVPTMVALGVQWHLVQDCELLSEGALARLSIPEAKAHKYLALAKSDLRANVLSPSSAAKRAGQMESLASSVWGAQTRPLHWPLYERRRQPHRTDWHLSDALRWSLREYVLHLQLARPRLLHTKSTGRARYVVFSDARGRLGSVYGSEMLGGAVLPPQGTTVQGLPAYVVARVHWLQYSEGRLNRRGKYIVRCWAPPAALYRHGFQAWPGVDPMTKTMEKKATSGDTSSAY